MMNLKFGALLTAMLSSAFSQSSSPPGTTTLTTATTTHTVAVGADGYNFTPNQLNANAGDIIEYRFYPQNHSVARAAFAQPCIPYEDTGPNRVGFWSGFQPVALVLSYPPIFQLPINDTEPVFFYCSAPGACFDGMIGVINPNDTWTFSAQFNYSQNATEEFSPLEYFPKETINPTRGTTLSSSPAANSSLKKDLSTGGIVGIAIGILAAFGLGLLIYMRRRQKATGEILRNSEVPSQARQSSYVPSTPEISEAKYPNIQKADFVTRDIDGLGGNGLSDVQGVYGQLGTKPESGVSPPIDERAMEMQPMSVRDLFVSHGQSSHGMIPTARGINSPGSPSPMYTETHGMENGHRLRPHHRDERAGPHEMPDSSPSAATPPISPKPFSITDSESGYRRDEKIGSLNFN